MGLANYTTALLDNVIGPGKAALELAVNGMPENQTMSFVAAVANASGEGANKTVNAAAEAAEGIGSAIGGAVRHAGDAIGGIGNGAIKKTIDKIEIAVADKAEIIGSKVMPVGKFVSEKAFDEAEGATVSKVTNESMKGILGESNGLPKNREPVQEQTEELKEALKKPEVDFDDLSLLDQFREIGRRLSCLGL